MKRLRIILLLLLSLALLWTSGQLGRDGLRVDRRGGCVLWLPPVHEHRGAPAVILCGSDRGLALELCRRGYAVAVCADPEKAYGLLAGEAQVERRELALISVGKSAGEAALSYALAADHPINGLILWHCPADGTDALCNVLSIDDGESALTGYFADGTARQSLPYGSRREATEKTICWIGSTLGHPRDGVFSDDEFIYPYANGCRILGPGAAVAALWLALDERRKKDEAAT